MKRFWDQVMVAEHDQGHAILLDGKPMRVPGGGGELQLPTAALAQAVAREWQLCAGGHKGGDMDMQDVPLTRLAGTAQVRIAPDPAPVADALAAYAESDLLCYRAAHPLPLVVRQSREWQPWLDWLEATYGARLQPTEGVTFLPQEPQALGAIRDVLHRQSPAMLAGLGIAVPALGSAVLGLALAAGALDAARAHALASLDELFQAEQWGADEAATKRLSEVADDVALAARFMELAR